MSVNMASNTACASAASRESLRVSRATCRQITSKRPSSVSATASSV